MCDCCAPAGENEATRKTMADLPVLGNGPWNEGPAATPGCTLDAPALRERKARWTRLIDGEGVDREREGGVLRVRFRPGERTRRELSELVRLERGCCSHMRWDVTEDRGKLVLSIAGEGNELDGLGVLNDLRAAPRSA
jgi:hypothetical protein